MPRRRELSGPSESKALWSTIGFVAADYGYERCDILSFKAWADHCGARGYEFAHVFYQRVRKTDLLEVFSSAFDALIIEEGGYIRVELDWIASAVTFLGSADYELGSFSWRLVQGRANRFFTSIPGNDRDDEIVHLLFTDPVVEDAAEFVQETVEVPGTTDEFHARRQLARAARKARLEDAVIEFASSSPKAWAIKTGTVFRIASPDCLSQIASGNVLGVVANKAELDGSLVVDSALVYELTIVDADGVVWVFPVTPMDAHGFRTNWISLASKPAGLTVRAGDSYSLGVVGFSSELYRCMGRVLDENERVSLTAIRYDSAVYSFDDDVEPIIEPGEPEEVIPFQQPPVVLDLLAEWDDPVEKNYVIVSWNKPAGNYDIREFEVWYARKAGTGANPEQFVLYYRTPGLAVTMTGLTPAGTVLDIRVIAVTSIGRATTLSGAASVTFVA